MEATEYEDDNGGYFEGQRRNNPRYGGFKLKMDILIFNGTIHIEEFIEWMIEVERFFDYMNIEEER